MKYFRNNDGNSLKCDLTDLLSPSLAIILTVMTQPSNGFNITSGRRRRSWCEKNVFCSWSLLNAEQNIPRSVQHP